MRPLNEFLISSGSIGAVSSFFHLLDALLLQGSGLLILPWSAKKSPNEATSTPISLSLVETSGDFIHALRGEGPQ